MNMELPTQIRALLDQLKGSSLSIFRQHRLLFLLLVLPLLFMTTPGQAGPTAGKTGKSGQVSHPLTAEQQYQTAKAFLQRFETEGPEKKDRNSWLKIVQTFRMLHVSERKNALGPPSLFMVGKTEMRMYQLFSKIEDLTAARDAFVTVADLYPASPLADDALFFAGESVRELPGNTAAANVLYQKVITLYPQGDFAGKAKERMTSATAVPSVAQNSTVATNPTPVPATPVNIASSPGSPSAIPSPAEVAPIKYWSTPEYSRIVVQTTAPVKYSLRKDEKSGATGKRLTLDLAQGYLPAKIRNSIQMRDGLLQAIHPRQMNEQLARIDFDLQSLADYTIFTLPDPYRVIVDIRGVPLPTTTSKNGQNLQSSTAVSTPAKVSPTLASVALADSKIDIPSLIDQKKRPPDQGVQLQPTTSSTTGKDKLSLAQQLGLGVRKIVIDPGHGGKDPGAVAFGLKEKDIVLTLSRKLSKILRETYHYEIVLTRSKDAYVPLEERTAIANANKSDLFISLHINAHNDQARSGIETYFLNLATDANAMRVAAQENASSTRSMGELQDILNSLVKNSKINESASLARFVHTNLVTPSGRAYATRDLGVKQAPFFVLIGAQMPAILAEISFLTNPKEAKLLQSDEYLDKIATQMAAGIAAYVEHRHTAAAKY